MANELDDFLAGDTAPTGGNELDKFLDITPQAAPIVPVEVTPPASELDAFLTSAPTPEQEQFDTLPEDLEIGINKPDFMNLTIQAMGNIIGAGDEPGFATALIGGMTNLKNNVIGVPAVALGRSVAEFTTKNFPDSSFDKWAQNQLAYEEAALQQQQAFAAETTPVSHTLEQIGQASYSDFWKIFKDSPEKWTLVSEVAGNTISSSVAQGLGYVYSGLPGMFGTAYTITWGDEYEQSLAEGKSHNEALESATTKALIQAGIDTTTAGVARINLAKNAMADWAAQTMIQMAGGGGAEILKAEAVGETVTGGEVLLEVFGELVGGPIEIAAIRARGNVKKIQEGLKNAKENSPKTELQGQTEITEVTETTEVGNKKKPLSVLKGFDEEANIRPLHELTETEWNNQKGNYDTIDFGVESMDEVSHKRFVQEALLRGDAVPQRAMETYKDIQLETLAEAELANARARQMGEDISKQWIPPEMGDAVIDQLNNSQDSHNWFLDQVRGLFWIGENNKHIPGLARPTTDGKPGLIQVLDFWKASQSQEDQVTDQRLYEIKKLGLDQQRRLFEYQLEATQKSTEVKRKLTTEEMGQLQTKWQLNETAQSVMGSMEQDFASDLANLEEFELTEAARILVDDPRAMRSEIIAIAQKFSDLRNQNYFPFMRFGRWGVVGKNNDTGKVEVSEAYETESEQNRAFETMTKTFPNLTVSARKYEDNAATFRGMPQVLLDSMEKRLNLSEEQKKAMREIKMDSIPSKGFRNHLKNRSAIEGFSHDGLRAYASYRSSFARHMARLRFQPGMEHAVQDVRNSAQRIANSGRKATKRDAISQSMDDLVKYLMNPESELEAIRSFAAKWHLMAVPKSAFINLTQSAMITLPHLANRYGDVKAVAAMVKATGQALAPFTRKQNAAKWVTNAMVDPELQAAVARGVAEGHLDQSFATELAAVSSNSTLDRLLHTSNKSAGGARQKLMELTDTAMLLFQIAEKYIRRIGFIAAYNLEMDVSGNRNEAYNSGVDTTKTSLYDYTKANRPRLLRGRKGVFFVFWNFLLNSFNFFQTKGTGRGRALLLLVAAGGIEAIPFVGNIEDMIDFVFKKGKQNGWIPIDFGPEDARLELRLLVQEALNDPDGTMTDIVINGTSRYGYGLPWLGEQVGLPIPQFDVSGSVSFGRMIPGTEILGARDYKTGLARFSETLPGAALNMPLGLVQAVWDTNNQDPLQRWQRAMPVFAKNIMEAGRMARDGAATDKKGGILRTLPADDKLARAEIIAQAFGFPNTATKIRKEKRYMEKEVAMFYQTRRSLLLDELFQVSQVKQNREAESDVLKEIIKFNNLVPRKEFQLNGKEILRSLKQKAVNKGRVDLGLPTAERTTFIHEDIADAFPKLSVEELPSKR